MFDIKRNVSIMLLNNIDNIIVLYLVLNYDAVSNQTEMSRNVRQRTI